MILHKISRFFELDCYAFSVKVCILPESVTTATLTLLNKKLKVYLKHSNAYRLARFLMLQIFHISMF